MNKSHIFGYLLGLLIFVISIPALMWLVSGHPWTYVPDSAVQWTCGPYRLCRNPMLVGIYIFDAGVLVWLWSVWPILIFLIEVILLTIQVRSEQKKLFEENGIYHPLWLAMQDDLELTAVVRSRQLHIYRHGKKVLVLAGKAAPKIIREDKLCEML